jgi:hypothetical protein
MALKGSAMRECLRGSVLGLLSLILANCAGGGGTEGRLAHSEKPELLGLLQLGRPVLDCREACLDEWKRIQPKAMQYDAGAQWSDLAVLVMRSGYQDDLSLYYLGRAAEGMKFYAAAASYYQQSLRLSGTSISCAYLSRLCGGVTLPNSASERLALAEHMLVPRKAPPRRPLANPSLPSAESMPTAAQAEPTVEAAPMPPIVAAPVIAPQTVSPKDASEYIEPPPAPR